MAAGSTRGTSLISALGVDPRAATRASRAAGVPASQDPRDSALRRRVDPGMGARVRVAVPSKRRAADNRLIVRRARIRFDWPLSAVREKVTPGVDHGGLETDLAHIDVGHLDLAALVA